MKSNAIISKSNYIDTPVCALAIVYLARCSLDVTNDLSCVPLVDFYLHKI